MGHPPTFSLIIAPTERTQASTKLYKTITLTIIERQNLTMGMHMRRFTRLTNGFSKKVENHAHSVALHYMFYNFCRVHQTLRCTPAQEAGLTDHVWNVEELCTLLPKPIVRASTLEREALAKALAKWEHN